jgi:hypothetical protein
MKLSFDSSVSPPVTSSTVSDPLGTASWYVGPVTLTLTAFGPSSPVSATYYSADSAPYRIYVGPFSITGDGIHPVWFYSIDTAGRQESPHGEMIRIDVTKPMSHVATLPATAASPNFIVQWSCADAGSGLAVDTIYVSDNGGPFTVWWRFSATQQSFAGLLGHTYGFYSIARDNAGNQENPKTVAEAITHVPAQMAADVNGDGRIDCADIAIVKASMGKTAGQTGFDSRADVNHDGVVNVLDLATVSQKQIPGTKCP